GLTSLPYVLSARLCETPPTSSCRTEVLQYSPKQVVKPHAPLIKFPNRRDKPKLSASDTLRSAALPSHSSVISQHSKGNLSPNLLMHQGPPDTAELIKSLPQKYRRKPMSQEEMEFIQRGGPE
uniref:Alpha-ketoglutarate dehydrogenase subunit 4 n=1 Tax=Rattus norvegicus TaxID=10116 RepID=A0A8I5ZV77_RAT